MASDRRRRGFTLIEMVVGMVVLAIALLLMATLLFPLAERSGAGVQRARGAQLGQAVLAQLAGRPLDIATPQGGGPVATLTCCEDDAAVCAGGADDPEDPASWELLDRFHRFEGSAGRLLGGAGYDRFQVAITVRCQLAGAFGTPWAGGSKLAEVTVITPAGERLGFAQLRGNF